MMNKEMTEGDKRLKMQLFYSNNDQNAQNTEVLWSENGFFGDQRSDLTLPKADFPENMLVYVNQASYSSLKDGQEAIYTINVVLAQILPLANNPKNIKDYICKENEVKLLCPIYDSDSATFRGLEERLALIVVRGDKDECFLSYGYDPEKTKQLYSHFKKDIPNIFQSTAFKKFYPLLKSDNKGKYSNLFFFLPSTTDQKEKINQYKSHVQLYPVTAMYEEFPDYNKEKLPFYPHHLESHNVEERMRARETVINFMKHVAQVSNSNLNRNAKSLIIENKIPEAVGMDVNVESRFKTSY